MTGVLVALAALGILAALAARLRLWYYRRRFDATLREELELISQLAALRSECDRLWWEGQP